MTGSPSYVTSDHLITSRRNFLVRATAFTAAGATVTVPIITVADAKARALHHEKGLQKALCDLYPGSSFEVRHMGKNMNDPMVLFMDEIDRST